MDMCLRLLVAVAAFVQLCSAVSAETEKLGRCPSKGLLESSQCIDNLLDECAVDSDCEGSAKCCSTGCKRACVLPDFSTCQRIHVEFQKRARALGLDVETLAPPRCQPTGTFEPVQCNGTACWCVDKSGFEVAGTRARSLNLVDCKSPRPCAGFNCRMLCPYEFELDKDGCPLCQCRDPCRGIKCPGSQSCQLEEIPCEKEPCAPVPTCKQARSLDSLCPLGLPMTLPGGDKPYLCGSEAGKPTCPKQFDCHVNPGADYGVCCASVERLNKPGECPLSGPAECGVPCGKDIDCSGADKCCRSADCGKTCMPPQNLTVCRQHQAFTELLTLHEREGRGYIPQCTPVGNFELRQCSRNGLVCWCVNPQNGAQIRGSIGPASSVRCEGQSDSSVETGRADCGLTMCPRTCQYGYKLNENGCQTCDCEDPCVNFKCPEGSKCEKVPEDGCDGSRCPVKPQCGPVFIEPCSQGPHLKNDVTGLPVKCTVGSKFSCPSGYNCIDSFMHKTAFCCPKKEELKERDDSEMMPTVCQIMKRMSEENGRSLAENGMEMTIKSPKCTPTGEFDSLQCQDDSCWCVDEYGVEVPRSRGPRTAKRDCKRSRNDVDCQGSSMCRLGCDFGFVMDDDSGCPKCECRNPCDSVTCEEGKTCQVVPAPCEEADCPKLPFCLDVSRRSAEVDSTEDSLPDLVCPGGNPEGKLKTCRVRGRSVEDCHDGFGCYSNSSVEGSLGICCPVASQVPAKIGQCPFGTPIGSSCDIECATDLDCDGMTKCCSNGCGTQCVVPLLKTACGMEKDIISDRAKESGIPANRIYAPDCDTEGEYKQIQCHPGTRVCWCVDSVGRELAGTRSPPGIRPTCDPRALSEVCDPFDCDLDCPFGNALDSAGCPVCKCKDPCEKVRCGDNEICKVVELNCVSGPCPPLPICVPLQDKICGSGTPLEASDGHAVQCGPLGVSCPSSHKCNLSPFGDYAICCPKPREACAEPLITGFCNSSIPRWHFNTKSNRCEPFTFSGCGSNLNNFESEQHCKATCPVQTSCEKQREKNLRLLEKYKKVVFLPKCKEGGEFETVQCLDELGICWCVDKHGEPVKGTLTRGKPICSVRQARQHSIEKMICEEGVTVHVCDKSLCDNKVCIADPTARCKINACGGCKIEFYDARGSTVDCTNGLTKCQNHIQEVVNSPNWYRQDLEYGQNRDAEILPNFYTDYIRSGQSVFETSEGQDSALRHRRQAGMFDLSDIDDQIYDLVAMESQDSHSEFPQVLSVDGVPVENPPASIDAMPEFSSEVESLMDGVKIRYIGDAIKTGECPAVRQPSFLRLLAQVSNQCVDHCLSDADCPGQLRCCPGQCGHACQLPILPKAPVTKPGQCPFAQRICKDQSEKRSTCRRDWDCPADGKCCDTGCGSVCLQPEETQVKPSVLYLLPPRCTEAGEYSFEQRQGDLSWCVTEDGSPVQGSLTRGFVRCSSNGTVVERLSLGPVCPSADQAPKVCSTECLQASCPGHPDAVCVADPCNGCKTSFYTLEGEQVSCEPVCTQPKQVGNCRASFPRWHFNSDSRTCEEFYFGGCGGNDNNFKSLEECQEKCKAVDRCSLPTNVGTCGKQLKRWSFNVAEQKCQEFIFTGCGGNANNFITKAECEMTCPDLVMCPKLPDTAGEMFVCSRSEVCEEEGCPDEDVVCTVDPCTCAPVYRNRKGEKVECKRYHEEDGNFLSDAASSSDILARSAQTPPPMKVLPADVATETEEEKQIRDKSKSVETEVIKMHNPAQEFISRMGDKSAVKPLKKKKAKSMALQDVKVVTRCQKMRQRMAEEKSSFVVDCDKSGRFAPTQCYMGTPAVCWCVDESGNQLKDTTMFMSGNRTCHYVPVKAVSVSLAIPMHEDDHPETDLIQKQIDSMLSELNAQIELKAAGMNSDHMVRVNFTLIGENKIDVADYLEEMVKNGELELQMGDNIMPADFTSSRFVHIAGAPVIRQQRKLDTSLDNREIIAEAIDYEIPYFAIVVTMCVVSSVVICALILSLVLYRKKTTGEYPKGRRVPLAYGSYHSDGGKKEDVVPRGFPRVGLDEKDFASIKAKPLSPVLPRFMRNGNTESMKL